MLSHPGFRGHNIVTKTPEVFKPKARSERRLWLVSALNSRNDMNTTSQHTGAPGSHEVVTHKGSCHCYSVRFEFQGSSELVAWECNCSICAMKKNTHVIVPSPNFTLLDGESCLTEYQFGSKTARHFHCKVCGVTPFYVPRSNPDGYAITAACIDPEHIQSLTVKQFDGKNWEDSFASTGIGNLSK